MVLHSLEERIKNWPSIADDLRLIVTEFYRWMANTRSLSPYTIINYMSDLRTFFHFLSQHHGGLVSFATLKDLPLVDLKTFLAFRADNGIHKRSSARGLSALSTFCFFLSERNTPVDMPVALLARPAFGKIFARHVPTPKILHILSQRQEDWSDARDIAALSLLYSAGLRISEALSLNMSDWPEEWSENMMLHVQGKGVRNRQIPILECLHRLIEAYRAACPYTISPESPLFFGERGGRLNPEVLQARIRTIRRAAHLAEQNEMIASEHSVSVPVSDTDGSIRHVRKLLESRVQQPLSSVYSKVSQKTPELVSN